MKNVELVIIDNTEKSKVEELVEDLIQIITGARLNGNRVKETKELIKDLKNEL